MPSSIDKQISYHEIELFSINYFLFNIFDDADLYPVIIYDVILHDFFPT